MRGLIENAEMALNLSGVQEQTEPLKQSQSVAPCQVSYSLNSDLGTQYLIAEMLYIE